LPVVKPPVPALRLLLLVATLAAVSVAFIQSGVHAAGGAIQVLEMRQQVNFPDGVGLTITAESDADIVEVRVYFRAAGSRKWGYAYADFEPGSRVVATRSIPANEAAYLAPGVDVEYFYQIRDAQGAVLKTERSIVEYLDDRFDWRRVNIGPLELVYHDIRDDRVAGAARELSRDLQRVVDLLQFEPRKTFKGVIYNSYADANAVFPVQSQTTTDHGTFAGYAFPEQGVFVGQGLDRRIIVHESTHLLFREALGEKALDVPAWLDEGLATFSEPNERIRGRGELYGRTPPLRSMNRVSGTPRTIPFFYYKSVSVVAYLIEEYGEDNFRRMLDELRKGRVIEDALLNVYGFDVDGLDRRWAGLPVEPAATPAPTVPRSIIATQELEPLATVPLGPSGNMGEASEGSPLDGIPPGPAAVQDDDSPVSAVTTEPAQPQPSPPVRGQPQRDEPSPFVFIDVWVLAGVALLAVAAVGFRFIYRRLRRNSEDNYDSTADWDDWDC